MIIEEGKRDIQTSGITQQNTFNIKPSAKAFKILSDGLYQDKILAVVRELTCNAWDAHKAANKDNVPIEIHLPNMLEPWFHIKDFGTGLSHSNVMELYTTYFESTKTGSNDFIGALGLGSKSPFSYVDTFTVESRYNGWTRQYQCFIGPEGFPSIAVLSEYEEKTTNGLTITVPVKSEDFAKFSSSLKGFIVRMPTQPKVSGSPNWKVDPVLYTQRDTHWAIRNESKSQGYGYSPVAYAVQGLVAYPINLNSFSGLESKEKQELAILQKLPVDIFFPIGELEVAASRETLSYDLRTQKNILNRVRGITSSIVDKVIGGLPHKGTTYEKLKWYDDNFSTMNDALTVLWDYRWTETIDAKMDLPKTFTSVTDYSSNYDYVGGIKGKNILEVWTKLPANAVVFNPINIDPIVVNKVPYLNRKEYTAGPTRNRNSKNLRIDGNQKVFYSSAPDAGFPTVQQLKNLSKYIIDNPTYKYLRSESKLDDIKKLTDSIDGFPFQDVFIDIPSLPDYTVASIKNPNPKVKGDAKLWGLQGINKRGYSGLSNNWKEVTDKVEIDTLLAKPGGFYYFAFEGANPVDLQGRTLDKPSFYSLINTLNTYNPLKFPKRERELTYESYSWGKANPVPFTTNDTIPYWKVTKGYDDYFKTQPTAINIMEYLKGEIETFIKGNHTLLNPWVTNSSTDEKYKMLTFLQDLAPLVKNKEFHVILDNLKADTQMLDAARKAWATWESIKVLCDLTGFDHGGYVKTNQLTEFWDKAKVQVPTYASPTLDFTPKFNWLKGMVSGNEFGRHLAVAINLIP